MPFLPSLPEDAGVPHVYRMKPSAFRPWMRMGQEVMRGPSLLSPAEREMIAVYVSMLNGCEYCVALHRPVMERLGLVETRLEAWVRDPDDPSLDPRLQPLLHYVRKVTLEPSALSPEDAAAVFAAGWEEDALHDAIQVTCRFNFMNRLVEGHGLGVPDEDRIPVIAKRVAREGYARVDERDRPEEVVEGEGDEGS